MNLEVLGEKILVTPIFKKITETGIVIPHAENEISIIGEVAAVGNYIPEDTGCRDLKVGDKVTYSPYAVQPIRYENVEYYLLRPNDIIGRIQ